MYRHGGISPTLYVCGTRQTVSIPMPEAENAVLRVEQMINAAIQLAQSGNVGDIDLLILVTEAWVSPARQPFTIQPSKDPNRCEVLVVSALDGVTKAQKLLLYACIREQQEAVTDLKPLPVPADVTVEGPLLRAFRAGYRLAQGSLATKPLKRSA
jgi:hypothetical protein